ncbi:hypothetical protein GX441_06360 [bacterium]|nr:hypothetical protein [bacterium]
MATIMEAPGIRDVLTSIEAMRKNPDAIECRRRGGIDKGYGRRGGFMQTFAQADTQNS